MPPMHALSLYMQLWSQTLAYCGPCPTTIMIKALWEKTFTYFLYTVKVFPTNFIIAI